MSASATAAQGAACELGEAGCGRVRAPRAQLEQKIRGALKLLAGKPEHKALLAQLELVEINLPNLK